MPELTDNVARNRDENDTGMSGSAVYGGMLQPSVFEAPGGLHADSTY